VSGIAAAEIQSPDPLRLATRWSEILERPLEQLDALSIQLDNATLRFVEATDGRGEGLGGIDVTATLIDSPAAATVPETIGGLRITLV
jgi:hypothetical protein